MFRMTDFLGKVLYDYIVNKYINFLNLMLKTFDDVLNFFHCSWLKMEVNGRSMEWKVSKVASHQERPPEFYC